MKRLNWSVFRFVVACLQAMVMSGPSIAAQQQAPDLILLNGKILTVDRTFSVAQAVAIQGQRIAAVGSNEEVLPLAGPRTQKIDLKGRTIIPGLIDTHLHPYEAGPYAGELDPGKIRSYPVDWNAVKSKDDVLAQIKGWFDKFQPPPGQWIYIDNQIDFRREGTLAEVQVMYDQMNRWELDKVTPNNPVAYSDGLSDWNLFMVNSKAWDILMAKHGDVIKKYGRFWIDSAGRPNGHMEPPASRLVFNYLPEVPLEDLAPLQKKRLEELMGLTTFSSRCPRARWKATSCWNRAVR